MNPGSRVDAGGGGKSAQYDGGKRILAHPSKEITPNVAETMIIETGRTCAYEAQHQR